jgi:hypothetical protein
MRVRTLALALGVAALSLVSVTAFADEGGWRHEGRDYRQDYRPEYQRERWSERRDRCQDLRERFERDRAHYYHELREGDWREARELRERLQWTSSALARCGW